MKLADLTLREFIREVDSAAPAPGGGSVSALASALGAGLLRMVGHLTIPKKKFTKLEEILQAQFIQNHETLKLLENRLVELIDKDTEAFNEIMQAFKMPKETNEDQEKRNRAIESATLKAIEVPENIADVALEALTMVEFVAEHGNKNALSDVGVSALTLYAGLEGACLNMKINLSGLSDEATKTYYQNKIDSLIKQAETLKSSVLAKIHQAL